MAYLPFYITPEELAAYLEAQEQEILTGGCGRDKERKTQLNNGIESHLFTKPFSNQWHLMQTSVQSGYPASVIYPLFEN
ncbi:TPA: hypothetical protein I7204_00755 [Vibrio vulnificus]|nr:hypothetical protein [Vibrio vulnificus]